MQALQTKPRFGTHQHQQPRGGPGTWTTIAFLFTVAAAVAVFVVVGCGRLHTSNGTITPATVSSASGDVVVATTANATASMVGRNVTAPATGLCIEDSRLRDFNARVLNELVRPLVERPFFRHYTVQLENQCPCWADNDAQCMTEDCEVRECEEPDILLALRSNLPLNEVRKGQCHPSAATAADSAGVRQLKASCPPEVSFDISPAASADRDGLCSEAVVCLPDNPERFTGCV